MTSSMQLQLFILVCWILAKTIALAQDIPNNIQIGNIKLSLPEAAKVYVQRKISALQNANDYEQKVAFARQNMSLVEDIFKEYNLPDEFKFLLITDKVSSGLRDAGYWWGGIKDNYRNYNLTVNDLVDERANPITTTKKLAQSLRNNQSVFNNWLLTLLSYELGRDGVRDYLRSSVPSLNNLDIRNLRDFNFSGNIPPVLLDFWASKLAFQQAARVQPFMSSTKIAYTTQGQDLKDIAAEYGVPYIQLKEANPWLKSSRIPNDKQYDVILPIPTDSPTQELKLIGEINGLWAYQTQEIEPKEIEGTLQPKSGMMYTSPMEGGGQLLYKVQPGEGIYAIARKNNITPHELMEWNGLNMQSTLRVGQSLRVSKPTERRVANTRPHSEQQAKSYQIHIVQKGEGLFRIARQYGVSASDIQAWNNLPNMDLYPNQQLKIQLKKKDESVLPPKIEAPTPIPTPSPTSRPPQQTQTGGRTLSPKSIPVQIRFGGMLLRIAPDIREDLKKDVEKLTKSPLYFFEKLRRVDVYTPLVEAVLQREAVPLDFRYLPIQESAYQADAVSSSNAVGYWQFKEASGKEVGLRVDAEIDERKNIVSSTEAAAKYLKRSQVYFDNWIFSLLSYNLGFTGAKNYLAIHYPNQSFRGQKEWLIDGRTHWYVRKFIAHLIVFADEIGQDLNSPQLTTYWKGNAKTIAQIAQDLKENISNITPYNRWLKVAKVPTDKNYPVIVPK